jgi:hypothetical protein
MACHLIRPCKTIHNLSIVPRHSKALGYILKHSDSYSNKAENSATWIGSHLRATDKDWLHGYHANWTRIEWVWRVHMSRQISKIDWRLGLQATQKHWVTNVVGNSFYIVVSILISKTTTFTYEIRHLDPLTQTLLLSIIANTIPPHTLHGKCSELQRTLHNFYWFLILIHPFLTYSYNTNEGKQKNKTR